MTPEGKVKAAIKRWLKSHAWWYCMPATGGYGTSGVPDFIACRPVTVTPEMVGTRMGLLVGIEAKAFGKWRDTTELQDDQIKAIQAAGGHSFACDRVSELDERYPDG
jgi:hypothetical protein